MHNMMYCTQRIWLDSYLAYLLAIQYITFLLFLVMELHKVYIKSLILLRKNKCPIIWFCNIVLSMLWSRKNFMTFNDINQFNVIDNQASIFFSRGTWGNGQIPARHTYNYYTIFLGRFWIYTDFYIRNNLCKNTLTVF